MEEINQIITPTKKKKGLSKGAKGGLTFFFILLGITLALVILQYFFTLDNQSTTSTDNTQLDITKIIENPTAGFSFNTNGSIAVLYIEGVIQDENETYNQAWLLDTIENLTYDDNTIGILLYIDSPGGGVYQSDEVYLALEAYKKETEKPIWAYFGPLAASGGYYIACSADTIYANRNTLTGSIGVISSTSFDLTELMETYGIKMTTITAGQNKNMMNVNSPMTEEHRAIMQSIADEAYNQFINIVADSRDMNTNVIREIADGRIYTALQAKENGLIDSVGSLDDAITDMEINLFDGESVNVLHYYFEKEEQTLLDLFLDFSASVKSTFMQTPIMSIDTIERSIGIPSNMEYPAYYYHK